LAEGSRELGALDAAKQQKKDGEDDEQLGCPESSHVDLLERAPGPWPGDGALAAHIRSTRVSRSGASSDGSERQRSRAAASELLAALAQVRSRASKTERLTGRLLGGTVRDTATVREATHARAHATTHVSALDQGLLRLALTNVSGATHVRSRFRIRVAGPSCALTAILVLR
jgi:hypothetical protein